MAKDLPYFKFKCSKWLFGKITLETYRLQGIFINVCAYLWLKKNVSFDHLKARFRSIRGRDWAKLRQENLLIVAENGQVSVNFLAEQLQELEQERTNKRAAGEQGAKKRWQNHNPAKKAPLAKHGNKDKEEDKDKDKEEDKEKEKKKKKVFLLFDHWQTKKNIAHHKSHTEDMRKAEAEVIRNGYDFEDLKSAIDNYDFIMSQPKETYFGQYRHSFDQFFRKGIQKPAPFQKFLPEVTPLANLKKNKGNANIETSTYDPNPVI